MLRSLSGFIGTLLVAILFAAPAIADVTGSIENHLILFPSGVQTEAVTFEADLVTALSVNYTLSGLTTGLDIRFGTSGIENAVLHGMTNLGALSASTELVFAQPYACTLFPAHGQCLGPHVVPAADIGGGVRGTGLGLVQFRQELGINIAGIAMGILSIFEDVDFPDIHADDTLHIHHHLAPDQAYDVNSSNGWLNDDTPTFGFGGSGYLSGQTVSGIGVEAEFDFCADLTKYKHIKAAKFRGVVNEICASLDPSFIIEDGPVEIVAFDAERFSISNVPLGGFLFDFMFENRPLQPLYASATARGTLFNLAAVTVQGTMHDVTSGRLNRLRLALNSPNVSVSMLDADGDLRFDNSNLTVSFVVNPTRHPFDASLSVDIDHQGLDALTLDTTATYGSFQFGTIWEFDAVVGNSLEWSRIQFMLDMHVFDHLTSGAQITYVPGGMQDLTFNTGFTF